MNKCKEQVKEQYSIDIYDRFPQNDVDAWVKFYEYNFLYDRMFLCKFQGIDCAPMPIIPASFPVIVKPIVNLLGMGNNACIIQDIETFNKYKYCSHFWCKYVQGQHLSWDFLIDKGCISFVCCFEGVPHSKHFGVFEYWSLQHNNNQIPQSINKLISTYLYDYKGFINVETINNSIIECHLRVGDLDQLPLYVLYDVLLVSVGKKDTVDKKNSEDIFLFPVWQQVDEETNLQGVRDYLIDVWEEVIIDSEFVRQYMFDNVDHASPNGYKRWFVINTSVFNQGMKLKQAIEEDLVNKFSV